jgi:hypothetical protein
MANTLASVVVDFVAQTAKFQTDMNRATQIAEKSFARINRAVDAFKASLVGIGAGLLFGQIIKETSEAEKSMAQLEAAVKSTGGAAGLTAKQLADMASSLQKTSTFSDETIQSAQSLLLTFTKISKDVFPQATQSVLDIATRMGTDAKSAAIQLGKALNDPITGLQSLRRVGVSFSEGQKEMIKSLAESGKLMEAQKIILKELAVEFGGSAAAARNTLGGAIDGLKNSFGDFLEAIGKVQSSGLTNLINGLSKLFDEAAEHGTEISNALLGIAASAAILQAAKIPALFTVITATAKAAFIALSSGAGIATGGLSILAGLLITFKDTTFQIGDSQVTLTNLLAATWEKLTPLVNTAIEMMVSAFNSITQWIQKLANDVGNFLNKTFGGFIENTIGFFNELANLPIASVIFPQIRLIKSGAQLVKSFGENTKSTFDSIVKRAAELTKIQQKTGPSNVLPGGIKSAAEEMSKLAREQAKKAADFFKDQKNINTVLQKEISLHGMALELEKLKVQFADKVGRELLPAELGQLTQILEVRKQLKAIQAIKDIEQEYAQRKQIAELERNHMNELIPGVQTIHKLQQQGIELTEQQIEKIKQLSLEFEKGQLNAKTQEYIDSLVESNKRLEESLYYEKNIAEVLDAQTQARKTNKFISQEQLDIIAQQVKLSQQLESTKKLKEIFNANEDRNKQLQISLIKNRDIREVLIAQLSAQQSIGRELTDQEKSIIANQTAYKLYVEDVNRAEDIIKANHTEQEKFNDDYKELVELFDKGLLSYDQFAKAVKNSSPQFKKIKEFADDIASSFTTAIDEIVDGSKKIGDVFKDLGKSILKNIANQLLINPLQTGISNVIQNLFKVPVPGGTIAQGGIGSGIGGKPAGFAMGSLASIFGFGGGPTISGAGQNSSIQGGSVFANGPVYVSNGQVIFNGSNPLSNALNSGFSPPGLLPGLGGAAPFLQQLFDNPLGSLGDLFGGNSSNLLKGGISASNMVGLGSSYSNDNGMRGPSIDELRSIHKQISDKQAQMTLMDPTRSLWDRQIAEQQLAGVGLQNAINQQSNNFTMPNLALLDQYGIKTDPALRNYLAAYNPTYNPMQWQMVSTPQMEIPDFGGFIGPQNPNRPSAAGVYGGGFGTQEGGIVGPYFGNDAERAIARITGGNSSYGMPQIGSPNLGGYYGSQPASYSSPNIVDQLSSSLQNFQGGSGGYYDYSIPRADLYDRYVNLRGFAEGGRPPVGKPSIVGERGPELFVPDVAGRVISNSDLRGSSPNVKIINNTGMPIGAENVSVTQNGRDITIQLDELVASKIRSGGPTSRAIQQMVRGQRNVQR